MNANANASASASASASAARGVPPRVVSTWRVWGARGRSYAGLKRSLSVLPSAATVVGSRGSYAMTGIRAINDILVICSTYTITPHSHVRPCRIANPASQVCTGKRVGCAWRSERGSPLAILGKTGLGIGREIACCDRREREQHTECQFGFSSLHGSPYHGGFSWGKTRESWRRQVVDTNECS